MMYDHVDTKGYRLQLLDDSIINYTTDDNAATKDEKYVVTKYH